MLLDLFKQLQIRIVCIRTTQVVFRRELLHYKLRTSRKRKLEGMQVTIKKNAYNFDTAKIKASKRCKKM